jgi:hypothetical protein
MLIGLLFGQHPKDAVGSTARVLIPFLTIFVLIVGLGKSESWQRQLFWRRFVKVVFFFVLLSAIGKLFLVSSGTFYGSGLNQFSLGGFMLCWLILLLCKCKCSAAKKTIIIIIIFVLTVLSILSFKRGVWLGMSFSLLLIWLAFNVKGRISTLLVSAMFMLAGAALLYQFGFTDKLISRFALTFHGQGYGLDALDTSSFTRVAELNAAFNTLNRSELGLGWLTGLGPGAGYENRDGFPFANFNEHGEPYHIHAAIGIIIFRYGLLGLLFHMILVAISFFWFLDFAHALRKKRNLSPYDPAVVGFACTVGIVSVLPSLVFSNVYFGQLMFGFYLSLALFCYMDMRRAKFSEGVSSRFFREYL